MNGGSLSRGWRDEAPRGDEAAPIEGLPASWAYADDADEPGSNAPVWVAGGLSATALAWVGGALWWAWPTLEQSNSVAQIEFAGALAIVPVLLGIVWLLTLRTSRAEARRFNDTAATMRAESLRLEQSVGALTAAVSGNREALAEQVAGLDRLAEQASERLSAAGRDIAAEVARADEQSRTLAQAAEAAQTNLGVLIASLPRAQGDLVSLAADLERTGLAATEHAAALDAQIVALAQRGREADDMASGAAQRLAAHIIKMESTSETAGNRLDAVVGGMASAVDGLLDRTAEAVDEARKGIAAQGEAMLAMVGAHQASLDRAARDSADALAERINSVDGVIDRVAGRLERQRVAGETLVSGLEDGFRRVDAQLDSLHHQGVERGQQLAATISALGGSADAMTEALRAGESMAVRTIATAESLLLALDAAAREIDETLPDALARLDERIASSKRVVAQTKPELLALVTAAESTHDAVEAIAGVIADQRRTLDSLSSSLTDTLTGGQAKVDAFGRAVDDTIGRTHALTENAAPRLVDALLRVRETASIAADHARETLADVLPEATVALERAGAEALRRAAGDTVERQVRAIADAADGAVVAAVRATDRLSEQVRAISNATADVEGRLKEARAEREENDRNSLAKRTTTLIESLQSAAIDVTKTFAPDVADSAWAAYLKGDRGVFTRRAVRLLDAGAARQIGGLYDTDAIFRDAVNRYVHDFEAMLRAVLAQNDASPLGVTLLSSDMGKLYVALAQGIDRLQ